MDDVITWLQGVFYGIGSGIHWFIFDWLSTDLISAPYQAITKGIPWLLSAPVFLSIAFLVRVYTRSLMKDTLSFALVYFMIPWAYYCTVVGVNFFFTWSPPLWTFDLARWWIILSIPFCYVALAPRVYRVILFRIHTGKWPREFAPGPIKDILEDGRKLSNHIKIKG